MLRCIVAILDVVDIQDSRTVFVNDSERLFDNSDPLLVHVSTDSHDELVNAEYAISVNIEHVEENWHIFLRDSGFEIAASLAEFVFGECSGVIIVHDLENALESDDAPGTSCFDFVSEYLDELCSIRILKFHLWRFNLRLGLSVLPGCLSGCRLRISHATRNENPSEFFEVNDSIAALIIVTKDCIHVL